MEKMMRCRSLRNVWCAEGNCFENLKMAGYPQLTPQPFACYEKQWILSFSSHHMQKNLRGCDSVIRVERILKMILLALPCMCCSAISECRGLSYMYAPIFIWAARCLYDTCIANDIQRRYTVEPTFWHQVSKLASTSRGSDTPRSAGFGNINCKSWRFQVTQISTHQLIAAQLVISVFYSILASYINQTSRGYSVLRDSTLASSTSLVDLPHVWLQ